MIKDHCTYFPEYIFGIYIGDLCKAHDYWYSAKGWSKQKADKKLYLAVKKRVGITIASIMWIGVNTPIGYYKYNLAQKQAKLKEKDGNK